MSINPTLRRRIGTATFGFALIAASAACTSTDETQPAAANAEVQVDGESVELVSADLTAETVALFDSDVVHDIEVDFDQDAYDAMIATYETTGDKDWIEATITIDGTTLENVGMRLKGNSSLFGVTSENAENPEALPWLIRFDKYLDDQTYQGYGDIVIRSNSTETAMNEAVALELLGLTGLATEQAMATTFTVNGGETELRLAIEHPDEIWEEANFDSDESALYKADSTGDYSYRGDDPDLYTDVFDQKAGEDDLEPLIDFLEFVNNSDDDTFAADLADRLDVDAFATYLAFQDLIGNFDDIDGPGNNSYLHYDYDTGQFTVVNWDLNLAFNTANVTGGPSEPSEGGLADERPPVPDGGFADGLDPSAGFPEGFEPPTGGPGGAGGPGAFGSNVLVDRFMEIEEFAQMHADATTELTQSMYTSGSAAEIVDTWAEVLSDQAGDLVDSASIEADAEAILSSIQDA